MFFFEGAAIAVAVVVGGVLQRVAGMGFAMVVAPFIVLVLPGAQGVVFTNLCGAIAAALLIWPTRRLIDGRALALLAVGSIGGAVLGAMVVGGIDVALFRIVMGVVLILGIGMSLLASRLEARLSRLRWAAPAGAVTGALVTLAGIGGPPVSIYGVATEWEHRRFAATLQPFIAFISAVGAVTVMVAVPGSMPSIPPLLWFVSAAALAIGLAAGEWLSSRVTQRSGRAIVVILGLVGAGAALVSGVLAL